MKSSALLNKQIIEAVQGGMTYQQAADAFGKTRDAVAGICNRAGVNTGRLHSEEHRNAIAAGARRMWAMMTPEQRSERMGRVRSVKTHA